MGFYPQLFLHPTPSFQYYFVGGGRGRRRRRRRRQIGEEEEEEEEDEEEERVRATLKDLGHASIRGEEREAAGEVLFFASAVVVPNHQRWHAKMAAQSERAHVASMFFARLGAYFYAQSVLSSKVSRIGDQSEVY